MGQPAQPRHLNLFPVPLILPPVVLAMPFLVLYKELAVLEIKFSLILIYALMVLPIINWLIRDPLKNIPNELEQGGTG